MTATAPLTLPYLDDIDPARFDHVDYLASLVAGLDHLTAFTTPAGRRALTRHDPLAFALIYLRRHLSSPETGDRVTLSDFHVEICRTALSWRDRIHEPRTDRHAWVAPRNTGKPVALTTMVLMGDGSRKPIGEIEVGDWVITHEGRARRVQEVHEQGLLPVVRITTKRGRITTAALDHPFLTQHGWVNAGDLTLDHHLVTVPAPHTVTGATRPAEEFRMAGYFIGDGSATEYTTNHPNGHRSTSVNSVVTSVDDDLSADLHRCAETMGTTITRPPSNPNIHYVRGLRPWLRDSGVAGKSSHTKRVPHWVFNAPAHRIAEFVGAYFSCDGTIGKDGTGVEFYSVNRDLLSDVQHLLLRLGIQSGLAPKRGRYKGEVHHSFRLRVEDTGEFARIVPVHHGEKRRRLESATASGRYGKYDRIVAVERIADQGCRCLTVEEDHTFTADDLVVHNSTWGFLILPLWALAHEWRTFVLAFADSGTQAKGHLSSLKNELETNRLLREDYPELCRPMLRTAGGSVANRNDLYIARSGAAFMARGIDASTLGAKIDNRRPDLILLDDIEPDETNYSAYQKDGRLSTITDAVFPMNIYATVWFLGTTVMPDSIIHDLVRQLTDQEAPEWPRDERITVHYFPAIVVEDDGTERSLWPAMWSIEFLQSIRHTRSYAKNFDNDPMGYDGLYWTRDMFRYGPVEGITRTGLWVDPAVTSKDRSDYTAFAVIGYSPSTKQVAVYDAVGVRLASDELRDRAIRFLIEYPDIQRIVVEANQGGDLWRKVFANLGVPVVLAHADVKKETRLADALAYYQSRQVWHARRLHMLESQAVTYPRGQHDDVIDVVAAGVLHFLQGTPRVRARITGSSYL